MLHCTVYNEWTGDLSIGPFTNDRRRTNKQLTLNHLLTCAQLMRSWCAYFSAMQMHSENVCDKTTKSVCWTIFESVARNGPSGSINGHTRLVVYCFMQTTFRHQFMNIEWTIDVLWMRCIRIFCVRQGNSISIAPLNTFCRRKCIKIVWKICVLSMLSWEIVRQELTVAYLSELIRESLHVHGHFAQHVQQKLLCTYPSTYVQNFIFLAMSYFASLFIRCSCFQ